MCELRPDWHRGDIGNWAGLRAFSPLSTSPLRPYLVVALQTVKKNISHILRELSAASPKFPL